VINRYLEAASSYANDIDNLILLVTVITGFFFLLAQGLFFGFVIKFAEKEGVKAQYIAGEVWKEKKWVSIPHYAVLVFDVLIIVAAIRVWVDVKQVIPKTDESVRVIAQQWAWTFVHAGPDGILDTPDDIRTVDELHVELGKTYEYQLQSRDVLHSFSVPVFRLKQDAVPGRTIKGWFKPILDGSWDIQCTEICGIGHGIMAARIFVEKPVAHADWVKAHAPVAALSGSAVQPNNVPTPAPGTPTPQPEGTQVAPVPAQPDIPRPVEDRKSAVPEGTQPVEEKK
jgi:cytochrome c oxidase subunit 2